MIGFFWNRRKLDQQGVSQISAEEAVQRADINVAFICTENLSHEEQIRYFIHVSSVPFVTSQGLFVDAENACCRLLSAQNNQQSYNQRVPGASF